jgi:hypothetical protein
MTKSDKIREYFRKHPDADVAKVAAKFEAPKPMTYKLRKQVVQEWLPPEMVPMPKVAPVPDEDKKRRKVTLSRDQVEICNKLGVRLEDYVKEGLAQGVLKYDDETQGRKFDAGKLDWTLVPFQGLEEIVQVLMFGAQKYDRHNWRYVPDAEQRYSAAAFRHMTAHLAGETTDHETGLSHLAHAGCCILFLLALERQGESA